MNRWSSRLVLLPAAVTIILSTLCSGAMDRELTVKVCSTAKGNGSQANCAVPYKNTELVLSCDNEWGNQTDVIIGEPYWMKGGCGIGGGQDLGRGINYTVNLHGRRLTNSDSAIYCCTWKSWRFESEYSYSIDVNVHAPPQLNNVYACEGVDNSNCTIGEVELKYSADAPPLQLAVNFTGNGPFSVQWFHNGTEFRCQSLCTNKSTDNTQTLTLSKYSAKEAWMISGSYTAIVSNPYGSNSSAAQVRYHCVPSDPVHQKYQTKILNLIKGENLNYSFCELIGPLANSFDLVVCLTRNKSDNLEQLHRYTPGNCVEFNDGQCVIPFNNSITEIQVSMFDASSDKCFPRQLVHFVKKHVSLRDDGIVILGGYWIENSIKQYCSISLRVRSNPWPEYSVTVGVPVTAVVVVVMTLLIAIIIYKWHYKRHCESRGSTTGITDSENEHRSSLVQDETERLLERPVSDDFAPVRPMEPLIPRRYDHYESISILDDFPHSLSLGSQEFAQTVTIPAQSS